jgi:hypothetical protein
MEYEQRGTITVTLSGYAHWSGTYELRGGSIEVEIDFLGSGSPLMKVEGLIEQISKDVSDFGLKEGEIRL